MLIPEIVSERCISLVFCCTVFRRLKFHCGLQAKVISQPLYSLKQPWLWDKGVGALLESSRANLSSLEKCLHSICPPLVQGTVTTPDGCLQPHRTANPEFRGSEHPAQFGAKKQKQKNREGAAVGLCECCQGHLMLQHPRCRAAPVLSAG